MRKVVAALGLIAAEPKVKLVVAAVVCGVDYFLLPKTWSRCLIAQGDSSGSLPLFQRGVPVAEAGFQGDDLGRTLETFLLRVSIVLFACT